MNHEEVLVGTFIDPRRTERYLEMVRNPRKRIKFTKELAHFKALDPTCIIPIPPKQSSAAGIASLLKAKGAGAKCWVVSENSRLDAREVDLEAALRDTVGYQMGTLILSVPGRLGYFEDEDGRCILERK